MAGTASLAAAAALSSADPESPAAGVSAVALDLDRPDSGLTSALAVPAFPVSPLGLSAFAVSDGFLARLPPFGAVTASWLAASLRASAKRSFLSAAGSLVRSVPSAPGSPLNFCQSPVILKRARTGSVGSAPTDSQCCARSELTSMKDGSSFG